MNLLANKLYDQIGTRNGHYKFKENRTQKLIDAWEIFETKFKGFVKRGNIDSVRTKCALGLLIMMNTGIRVGNEISAEGYIPTRRRFDKKLNKLVPVEGYVGKPVKTFGLTTLQVKHVSFSGGVMFLDFLGKRQVTQSLEVHDADIVRACKNLVKGKSKNDLFLDASYYQLMHFTKVHVGHKFCIKDFRTAFSNLVFIDFVYENGIDKNFTKVSEVNKIISNNIEKTAEFIGHSKSICKNSYLSGQMLEFFKTNLLKTMEKNRN